MTQIIVFSGSTNENPDEVASLKGLSPREAWDNLNSRISGCILFLKEEKAGSRLDALRKLKNLAIGTQKHLPKLFDKLAKEESRLLEKYLGEESNKEVKKKRGGLKQYLKENLTP